MSAATAIDTQMRRFRQAVKNGEEVGRLEAHLGLLKKDEFMAWRDDQGLDAMHHVIMADNAEAVDMLLKLGYFARPFEPEVNLYTHFAARLGLRTILGILLTHRPDDFRISKKPLFVPAGWAPPEKDAKHGFVRINSASSSAVSTASYRSVLLYRKPSAKSLQLKSDTVSLRSTVSEKAGMPGQTRPGINKPLSPTLGSLKPAPLPTDARRPSLDQGIQDSGESTPKPLEAKAGSGLNPLMKTPLEVAAGEGHVGCVRLLLDMCVLRANPDTPCKGYLTLAALAGCPASMKLLLKTAQQLKRGPEWKERKQDKMRMEDFRSAVEICLQRARPQCLDFLLADNSVDVRGLFKNINFFHVLYTFSATYGKGAYGRLPQATEVLIRRGHDVQAKVPPRTYPLYTLITHSFCYHEYPFTEFYLECMKMLLDSGADPNFDEVEFEKQILERKGIKFAVGRNAYSSALHCLLETVETYASLLSSPALAVKFVMTCADILIQRAADVEKVGRIGDARSDLQGDVLHQYAKSSVFLGVDQSILRSFLRYGAEPGLKIRGKYAINVYFDKLFEALSQCLVIDLNHKYEADSRLMLDCLCDLMTPREIKDAHHIFHHTHAGATSEMVKPYVKMVGAELKRRSKIVRPLRGLAAWRVWKLCCKRADLVRDLPVTVEIKTIILPLIE